MIALIMLFAAEPQEARVDCKKPDTQFAMNECADRDFQRADIAMNKQWAKTKSLMAARDADAKGTTPDGDPSYVDALVTSQRAWLAFRDAECKVESYSMRGGSAQPLESVTCKSRLTAGRTRQLAQLAKDL